MEKKRRVEGGKGLSLGTKKENKMAEIDEHFLNS